mmetsp:Transcript_33993/g.54878  ORF Transcript_33993/g.54878 Transcript_33993/m.54878 type:complete len:148 (-) Transcript_33993:30-473(-)
MSAFLTAHSALLQTVPQVPHTFSKLSVAWPSPLKSCLRRQERCLSGDKRKTLRRHKSSLGTHESLRADKRYREVTQRQPFVLHISPPGATLAHRKASADAKRFSFAIRLYPYACTHMHMTRMYVDACQGVGVRANLHSKRLAGALLG